MMAQWRHAVAADWGAPPVNFTYGCFCSILPTCACAGLKRKAWSRHLLQVVKVQAGLFGHLARQPRRVLGSAVLDLRQDAPKGGGYRCCADEARVLCCAERVATVGIKAWSFEV